ncbi:MAG: MBOAT family protein, partial [Clostridia bacterium]|nr:MBOAT family protein [Clostridia bacterium]
MVFSSLFFLYVFMAVVFLAYYLRKDVKYRNFVLIIASLVFYAWGEPVWVFMLIFSAAMNWFMGLK